MEAGDVRARSIDLMVALGLPEPPAHLPSLVDPSHGFTLRPLAEIIARVAALDVVAAVAYGLPVAAGRDWIFANVPNGTLTAQEEAFLNGAGSTPKEMFQSEIEAIWALSWVVQIADALDPAELCADDLVRRLPDLKQAEALDTWMSRSMPTLRSAEQILSELDFHYCLTWGLAELNLRGAPVPQGIAHGAIWKRRQALEFVVDLDGHGFADWDEIDLST